MSEQRRGDTTTTEKSATGALERRQLSAWTGPICAMVFIGGLALMGLLVPASSPPNLPSSAPADIQRYVLQNSDLLLLQALLHMLTAVLLGLFTVSGARLARRSAPQARGLADGAIVGGVLAAAFLAVSALLTATLGAERISDAPSVVSALRQFNFFVGGVGHTVWLGVLVGALSLATSRGQTMPRWLTGAGLVAATLAMLSTLSLVAQFANLFIPIGRFGSLLVIAAMGITLGTGRAQPATRKRATLAAVLGGFGVVVAAIGLMVFV